MPDACDATRSLANIERTLADLTFQLQYQAISIAQLRDELQAAQRANDWYNVQFSQILRLLSQRSSELRAALLYSVVNDRPIRPEVLQALLQLSCAENDASQLRAERAS
jgi:(p)ppGpp synthase/HD superfamily hydrolase